MGTAVAGRLESIKSHAGVNAREIAALLGTSAQTVSRWQQGHVDPQPTKLQGLLALEWLATQLADYYEPEEARMWLFSRHRLLKGRTPAELVSEGASDEVLALIAQLDDGAVV
ncbi:MAG: DUF2384 domain-containing protein [Actinobacteria bacterium]|nr:DUF2384 domain-containing protein [Actinomycetota bacterium]